MNTPLEDRDMKADEIIQLLKDLISRGQYLCRDVGNGTHLVSTGFIRDVSELLAEWDQHNRAFEATIRK